MELELTYNIPITSLRMKDLHRISISTVELQLYIFHEIIAQVLVGYSVTGRTALGNWVHVKVFLMMLDVMAKTSL